MRLCRSTDWVGLNMDSREANLSAELNLSFEHARLVGYAYSEIAEGPVRQRHGVLLATSRGLRSARSGSSADMTA